MLSRGIILIMLMVTILTAVLFTIVMIQDGVGTVILNETAEQGINIISNVDGQNNLIQRANNYDDIKLNYDYIFFVGFVSIQVTAILFAIISPKIPNFSFVSFLFIGTIFILYFYPLIMQIDGYLYEVFFNDIFGEIVLVIPFYNFVMNNQYFIFAISLIMLISINKLFGRDESLYENQIGGA